MKNEKGWLSLGGKTCYNKGREQERGNAKMPQIIEITDLSRPELDVFCRLTEAQLRNRLEP